MANETSKDHTPGTPDLSETELRRLHIDELRELARREGIRNADELRKEELVDAVSAKHRQSASRAEPGAPSTSESSGGASGRETDLRQMHLEALRELARKEGISHVDQLRKDELVEAISMKHQGR
jgi:transcription termination factor Rho